jgi:hypothetical protein
VKAQSKGRSTKCSRARRHHCIACSPRWLRAPCGPHQTFLELIKLYKNVLSHKRKETQEAIDRLENGLNKLHETQVGGHG